MQTEFDPNAAATDDAGIFGLPFTEDKAKLVLIPVPWEATTSYGGGTSQGPEAIFEASHQVDLFDVELGHFYEEGIHYLQPSKKIEALNRSAKLAAKPIIKAGGVIGKNKKLQAQLKKVNEASRAVNQIVYAESKRLLNKGKLVGLVGGDHSTPFGHIKAVLEKYPNMGLLHFDAHADLRVAYEGFEFSHASIMHNVMTKLPLKRLIQVGIRDFCKQEHDFIKLNAGRIITFFDQAEAHRKMAGESWGRITEDIIAGLPKEVYISFDIDGLDPKLCPHTGTPVPGGLSFHEAVYVIKRLVETNRKIVGFDLNEVAPGPKGDEWDANVGARLLFKLCGYALDSNSVTR